MNSLETLNPKITAEHLAKRAYVYVRQSCLAQVIRHGESTTLQYSLAERVVELGWPRDRVKTIDQDLGKSGSSATDRQGFQQLMTEIGLGRVGLVVSWDASRLARNNSDWYQLLELCSHFGTLIADGQNLYDPRRYSDRMMLGLSGLMSEAELHQIRRRLHTGARNKAERGELCLPLPVGLVRLQEGDVILNPDEEVQARIRLVFQKFKELGSARAVARYLRCEGLLLPSRPLRGPAPHEIMWNPANGSAVRSILKNPAYAGAYTYGRSTHDPTRQRPGRPRSGTVSLPIDKWPVLIHNVYPAYITWNEFLANQAQLWNNQSRYREDKCGVPREGQALLQGILLCGRCGARMRLYYAGTHGEYPVYKCDFAQSEYGDPCCQQVRGHDLDAEVERLVLAALARDRIALALAALEQLEKESAALQQQWQLRLERVRYEAERAHRQYNAVEPENRLVARTLERQWENKLRAVEKTEHEYQTWQQQQQLELTLADRQEILALGGDLPKLWKAPSMTSAERKQIIRLVIKDVIVDQHRAGGKVWFQINWQTGALSEHWYIRRVLNYTDYAHLEVVQKRVRELNAEYKVDAEIAAILNAEGFRTARKRPFNGRVIYRLRKKWGIPGVGPSGPNPPRWEDGTYSAEGAATAIGVFIGTIYQWLRCGRLQGYQLAKGMPWRILLTEEQIASLKNYVKRVSTHQKEAL